MHLVTVDSSTVEACSFLSIFVGYTSTRRSTLRDRKRSVSKYLTRLPDAI
jgi:hypothetical protein